MRNTATEVRPDRPPSQAATSVAPVPAPAEATAGGGWLRERIEGRVALVVGGAWFVLFQVAALLEPTTTESVPVAGIVLEAVMWSLLVAMIVGLVARRRWGIVASLGAATIATAGAMACPTSGHHDFGAWWYGQMACVVALLAVSVVALRTPAESDAREVA